MVRDYKGRILRRGARGMHPLFPDNLRVYDITSRLKRKLLYCSAFSAVHIMLFTLSSAYFFVVHF